MLALRARDFRALRDRTKALFPEGVGRYNIGGKREALHRAGSFCLSPSTTRRPGRRRCPRRSASSSGKGSPVANPARSSWRRSCNFSEAIAARVSHDRGPPHPPIPRRTERRESMAWAPLVRGGRLQILPRSRFRVRNAVSTGRTGAAYDTLRPPQDSGSLRF